MDRRTRSTFPLVASHFHESSSTKLFRWLWRFKSRVFLVSIRFKQPTLGATIDGCPTHLFSIDFVLLRFQPKKRCWFRNARMPIQSHCFGAYHKSNLHFGTAIVTFWGCHLIFVLLSQAIEALEQSSPNFFWDFHF